jgi:hypothetical protein
LQQQRTNANCKADLFAGVPVPLHSPTATPTAFSAALLVNTGSSSASSSGTANACGGGTGPGGSLYAQLFGGAGISNATSNNSKSNNNNNNNSNSIICSHRSLTSFTFATTAASRHLASAVSTETLPPLLVASPSRTNSYSLNSPAHSLSNNSSSNSSGSSTSSGENYYSTTPTSQRIGLHPFHFVTATASVATPPHTTRNSLPFG